MKKYSLLFYIMTVSLFSVLPAVAQNPILFTGWDSEGIKGEVESMTTSQGKEVKFDSNGNITSLAEKFRAGISSYSDPLHYMTDYQVGMEISFPDEFTRLEKGVRQDGNEIINSYTFDDKRRIKQIVLDDVYSLLEVEYTYNESSEFPESMKINYSNEAGEWKELHEFTYWAYDHAGNWVQRMASGWSEESDYGRQEFYYTETAVYNYSTESAGVKGYEIPDFLTYQPHHPQSLVTTEYDGVFSLFDDQYAYGWTMFLFIPKNQDPGKWFRQQICRLPDSVGDEYAKIEVLLEKLNESSFRDLSRIFDIFAYNIAPTDLIRFPLGDSPYEGAASRTEHVCQLDYKNEECILRESFAIEPGDRTRLWSWLERLVDESVGNGD